MFRVKVALGVPLPRTFDYVSERPLDRGARVLVDFANRELVGFVVDPAPTDAAPPVELKPIKHVLDPTDAFTSRLWQLLDWMAEYYLHPLGAVLATAVPAALRRPRTMRLPADHAWVLTVAGQAVDDGELTRAPRQRDVLRALRDGPLSDTALRRQDGVSAAALRAVADKGWIERTPLPPAEPQPAAFELNPDQHAAVRSIAAALGGFRAFLLLGVTGSGKTEVYLELMAELLREGRQCLVIVPEIGLTPQLMARFERRLGGGVAVLHSALSDGQRLSVWERARRGELQVVVGTRSALFTPLARLGLIVVDEEHDASLKQDDGLRYSARDGAVKRAQIENIPVVLGSATPALETLHNARQGRYELLRLDQRAGSAQPPRPLIQDLRTHDPRRGALTPATIAAIETELEAGNQVLVFHNRRGYAPTLMCELCGWYSECPACDSRLTLHHRQRALRCHHCGHYSRAPDQCPQCDSTRMLGVGFGTERLEREIERRFGATPIERIDRDTVRGRNALEAALARIREGHAGILLGTQMLAKGHDFPRLTLVVVVNMDRALFSADFRAPERAAQLLLQVAGRAGRAERAGTVILQTHHPEHALYRRVLSDGYEPYASQLLGERREAGFPPHAAFALLRAEARDVSRVEAFLQRAMELFGEAEGVDLFGPLPAAMERVADRHRWQVLARARQRHTLQAALRPWVDRLFDEPGQSSIRWSLDVDPLDTA